MNKYENDSRTMIEMWYGSAAKFLKIRMYCRAGIVKKSGPMIFLSEFWGQHSIESREMRLH